MPKLIDGFPADNGATDGLDSARLAGVMAMLGRADAPNCAAYGANKDVFPSPFWQGVRHPTHGDDPRTFSRDQTICLAAGLKAQSKLTELRDLYLAAKAAGNRAQNYMEWDGTIKKLGADYIPPHVMGAMAVACNEQVGLTLWQLFWLLGQMIFNSLIAKKEQPEPNQMFATCFLAGRPFIKLYKIIHRQWRGSIVDYWCGWRNEPELANDFINWVEEQ